MPTYYIDSLAGDSQNDGLSELSPLDTHEGLALRPGDRVLFRRGTSYRRGIHHKGIDGEPVVFGAYGNGEPPKFYGSVNRSEAYLWQETDRENVWKLAIPLKEEPCNVIFDFGDECGRLSWSFDGLDAQGKWWCDALGKRVNRIPFDSTELFLYSNGNPGEVYRDIEVALYGERILFSADKNAVFEGLCATCAGVHGFAATRPDNIRITDCRFEYIGGCVWDLGRKIRFGNGVECWNGGRNVTVTDCAFYEIFDSCFTTQGGSDMTQHENIRCIGNTMMNYGMAAFELRDIIGRGIVFEDNECEGAGLGFSQNGEPLPRYSEIYPEPMGHHIFIWRGRPAEGGSVSIKGNIFRGTPTGERVYIASDSKKAAEQVFIGGNEVQK